MNATTHKSDVFRTAILAEIPRVLGLMDREPYSPTLGCCDRVYWAWKFTDFPGARFQEALCILSFVYTEDFRDNPYRGNPGLLDWICNGLQYWASLQYQDGSFDEAYPYERSLAATAFTTFYVGEAVNFLDKDLPSGVRNEVVEAMKKAGTWLCRNDETHGFLSNHLAAAAAALYHVYQITGDSIFNRRSQYYLKRILAHQSAEGWYDEYGSADPGYQTHGSFYLARLLQLTGNRKLASSLTRSTDFIARFIHVDKSIGGEYASRNTQTYYPAAFEMLASQDAASSWVAEFMRPGICSGSAADLCSVDAYNYFPFLNNMVFAYQACTSGQDEKASETKEPGLAQKLSWYPEAGLARIRTTHYDAYIGTAKGGVLKVFDRRKKSLVYSDCGYLGKLHNGKVITTQHMQKNRGISIDENRVSISGAFIQVAKPVMKPLRFIGFRVFMLSVGRFPSVAQWLKQYLVKVLIYKKHDLNIDFNRTITFSEKMITVSDEISGPDGNRVASMKQGGRFTTIHMGSSRYFINNELYENAQDDDEHINCDQLVSGIKREHSVSFT